MDNKKKSNKKDIVRKIILIVAIITLVVSGYKLFSIWQEYHKNAKTYDEVREYSPQSNSEDSEDPLEKYRFKQEDFDKLFSINNDFKGWITVPNTEVDYPIVQTTDNEYYLHHNFKKEYNEGGAIFIASENTNPFIDENTVIHG
ncbi:MAG: SrtB family sortase, partial [Clostridiales bacterium]|nr:SrtB family sortase [Clostridiales bacterium]